MRVTKRNAALMMAAVLLLTCLFSGCSKDGFPSNPAATQGEIVTSSEEFYNYFAWVALNFETNLNRKMPDFADEIAEEGAEEGTEEGAVAGQTFREVMIDTAISYAMTEKFLWHLFEQRGLSMTDAEEAEVQQEIDYYKEISGSEEAYVQVITSNGMTIEFFENNLRTNVMSRALMAGMRGEEGLAEADIMAVADEEFVRVKHILVKTINDNYEALPEDEVAAKTALKDDLLARLDAGEDFEALLAEYGEDPGMLNNPDGYVIDWYVSFDPAFLQVSMGLAVDEIELAEGQYGYHIIKRYPLRAEDLEGPYLGSTQSGGADTVGDTIFYDLVDQRLVGEIEEFRTGNEVVRDDGVIDKMVQRYIENDTFEPVVDDSGLGDVPNLDDLLVGDEGDGE